MEVNKVFVQIKGSKVMMELEMTRVRFDGQGKKEESKYRLERQGRCEG